MRTVLMCDHVYSSNVWSCVQF